MSSEKGGPMTFPLTAIPVKALIRQGYFWSNVTVIRLFGFLALQSKN